MDPEFKALLIDRGAPLGAALLAGQMKAELLVKVPGRVKALFFPINFDLVAVAPISTHMLTSFAPSWSR